MTEAQSILDACGHLRDRLLAMMLAAGIRLGELLDLELDCIWDSASHGSWLKVPLGKLATERTVPLDEPTLAALDEWMACRGPQRALPHPRLNRPADFLFTERGRRLTAFRLRRGLDDAAAAAGLRGRDGQAMHVTPHQLRHTYATTLKMGRIASDATFPEKRDHGAAGDAGRARGRVPAPISEKAADQGGM